MILIQVEVIRKAEEDQVIQNKVFMHCSTEYVFIWKIRDGNQYYQSSKSIDIDTNNEFLQLYYNVFAIRCLKNII